MILTYLFIVTVDWMSRSSSFEILTSVLKIKNIGHTGHL